MRRLIFRSLAHYWRTNAAMVAGVAAAVAVLSGALLVGQSVRASLRALVFERLGATDVAVSADRFFPEDLAARLSQSPTPGLPDSRTPGRTSKFQACPVVVLKGTLVHERNRRRAYDVNVYGVDARFWHLQRVAVPAFAQDNGALVGTPLASRLGAQKGDGLLLHVDDPRDVPAESMFGRREASGRTVRLTCEGTLPPATLGEFALRPSQGEVLSVFVPLARLQRALGQRNRVNTVLIAETGEVDHTSAVRRSLKDSLQLDDAGVRVRRVSDDEVVVDTSRIVLDDSVARAVFAAAAAAGAPASGVLTYLANAIRAHGREVPYSVVSAVELEWWIPEVRGPKSEVRSRTPDIYLNAWTARDLGVSVGEPIELDYYAWQEPGELVTRAATFQLAGIVPMGGRLDSTLAPEVAGVTDAKSMADWDPPFPIDLQRIRPQDERYWGEHRATPKAVVSLARGQELWQTRFGRLTSIRVSLGANLEPFAAAVRARLDPEATGFRVAAVRRDGLDRSQGAVDLGEYFVAFSFFLIVAALLMSASFFRLGVEQRAREIGTLRAVGFGVGTLQKMYAAEAAVLAGSGSLLGAAGAVAYGALMILGLRTWWSGAVGTERLYLSTSWNDLAVGALIGIAASIAAAAWTLGGLRRASPRALLSGAIDTAHGSVRRRSLPSAIAAGASLAAAAALVGAAALERMPQAVAFFGGGALLLVAALAVTNLFLKRARPRPIAGNGWPALLRLGARSATHRPGRSLFSVGLVAAAVFVIVSVEAFRKDPRDIDAGPHSGTGGYALVASAALPIAHDLNSAAGRDALGISDTDAPELKDVRFAPFRVRPGDDASCLNLYAPREPRILGAPHAFVAAGRFSFAKTLAATPEDERNPWRLLEAPQRDGTIPAIADANTLEYSLHLEVGQEMVVPGNAGAVRLRIVAALSDSVLQGEVIVSEANFLRAFPRQQGYQFFLVETPFDSGAARPPSPQDRAAGLAGVLGERLADWNVSVEPSAARLAAYHRVENTYLSTFQSLGVLGLLLGTIGLATILLRNVLERRKELALLRAVGFRRPALAVVIVAEQLFLMIAGLFCGTIAAGIAIVPAFRARGGSLPLGMLAILLGGVMVFGLASAVLAGVAALRSPLLAALRSD
ncbi:MAG: FtsX-like permease family protein [Bacteroidales bacterium]